MAKVSVVTGSNKGIGFAIVKGLCQKFDGVVYLTSRDETRGLAAVQELKKQGLNPEYHQLDVADRSSIERFKDHIQAKYGGLDILVNNAAIAESKTVDNGYEVFKNVIDINYRSLLTMQELIYPLVRSGGRILNISSNAGLLANLRNKFWIYRLIKTDLTIDDINDFVNWFLNSKKNNTFSKDYVVDGGMVAAYRISKIAVNALTEIQQKLFAFKNISVNCLHPGYARTDMTSGHGFYTIDEAAETPLYILLEAPDSLKGSYLWYDKKVVNWRDHELDTYLKLSDFL